MPDPVVVESDIVSAVAMSAQKTYKQAQLKIGWKPRPLLAIAEANKQSHGPSGQDGEIIESAQLIPELLSQFWRGNDAIMAAQTVRDTVQFAAGYFRHVIPITFNHDEWLQRGYLIKAHSNSSKSFEERVKQVGEARLQKIKNDLVAYKMEGVNKAFDDLQDLAFHRQGATTKDPIGLNAMLPLATTGNIYGLDRQNTIPMQHLVRRSTIGVSGTMVADIETDLRELGLRNGSSGLNSEFVWLAGGQWIDALKSENKKVGKWDLNPDGQLKLDTFVLDKAMKIGGEDVIYDPTLTEMDSNSSAERGLSISTAVVTFSGGGSPTRLPTGYAVVSAGGVILQIIVTDRGAGLTAAPSVAVSVGSGATFQARIYSTSSGAAFNTVESDDARIGKLSDVAVTAGGTGFPVGDSPLFDKRAFRIPRKALTYKVVPGLERDITVPAESRSGRNTEFQMETAAYWYNRYIRGCYLHYIV